MIELKTFSEIDEYNYKVCQIISCEEEGTELYSDEEETKNIDVCYKHYKYLQETKFW
jgi:hypothetical protein